MVYGVYVGSNRLEGKLVFSTMALGEAVKEARKKERRNWVWVQIIGGTSGHH